ncbi:hypothetical protein BJ742DRAFT_859250 [Cladochytrium replicatum]|nr:hypothetical protein BJ742DRAFT_859250 [Cladochytrium replicatum]
MIHHSQFTRQERTDNSLPLHVKHCIIEESPARLQSYQPEKVFTRTDQRLAGKDSRQIAYERFRRREEVFRCGFCSDPKEAYKPLGDPILDSDTLLSTCLKIDPNSFRRTANSKTPETNTRGLEDESANRAFRIGGTPTRNQNGFSIIQGGLLKSKRRLHSVKFGVPFLLVAAADATARMAEFDFEGPDINSEQSDVIDWENAKIDTDKQAYFTTLYEARLRFEQANKKGGSPPSISQKGSSPDEESQLLSTNAEANLLKSSTAANRIGDAKSGEFPQIKGGNAAQSSAGQGWDIGDLPSRSAKGVSRSAMEAALNLQRTYPEHDPTERFFECRNQFYDQCHRLKHVLKEDLSRMDYNRKDSCQRKMSAFRIRKNSVFVDDISIMRRTADAQRKAMRSKILKAHPWYNELVNKMVLTSGALGVGITPTENVHKRFSSPATSEDMLINRIRGYIEDQIPFTKKTLVQLMKVVSPGDFNKEEVQRIIRFIKQHESISERDYVEAIEIAGHSIDQV